MKNKIKKYLRWIKFYFSSNPFYLIFYITSRCNARCDHCFNWKLVEDSPNRKELTLKEIEKMAKNWGDMLIVNLAGGEPYLRSDLPEIVALFKKYTGVEIIAIPSNGLATDITLQMIEKLLIRFSDIHFRFTFSIDDLGDRHDEIRHVPGAFNKVTETIKQVSELKERFSNFSLFTNSCFMQSNQDHLLSVLKYIEDNLRVDAMSVTYIRGDAKIDKMKQSLYDEKYKKIINYLSAKDRKKFKNHPLSGFIWGATLLARKKVFENLKTQKRNFKCFSIKKMVVLEDNGNIKVCEILPTVLGNLRDFDYDIKKVIKTDIAKSAYKKIKNCECNCTWECAIRTGIIYNPLEYFNIFRSISKK
jgi:MoaA/NifB/PqqE/SkfB family radical SAM enzyme